MARIEANSKQQAWEIVNNIFPTDYSEDIESSDRAGYPIFRSSIEHYNYICDLGDRLEINLKEGNRSINVWIVQEQEEEQPELPTKEEIKAAAAHQYTFDPEQVQLVRVFASGHCFDSEESRAVYKAMCDNEIMRSSIATDMVEAYCEDKGIEWGTIRVIGMYNHESKDEGEGHYVIEAIVGARVKE